MLRRLFNRLSKSLPSQCLVCHSWPAQSFCEACVNRFAQPVPRCQTCALPIPESVDQCGACLVQPPPLDACLAAVAYDYPWSDLIVGYKFREQPGRASAFALLLRSTPWVEPALEAADLVIPMPLSRQRLQRRGFNQALVLARALAPEKTHHQLLLRIQDNAHQISLKRTERLASVKHAFAVEPLLHEQLQGKRVVLVDDVMTSGATLFSAAQTLKAAGVAHITALVIARTEFER